ncbi:hypothetical protein [Candidatus Hecatella orcuttiae]|jgi:hypothetical protein|uniref:hypothetical protein n=1 Tax=Candidatus Hecatella orcuttiae TaxID=1935119 RepID=UPI0028680178|nr:hypothetical protein [Candidatus Hecatella orcuttiae]
MKSEKPCKYRGEIKLGNQKWNWCFFYNSKIGDVSCEKCEIPGLNSQTKMKNTPIV